MQNSNVESQKLTPAIEKICSKSCFHSQSAVMQSTSHWATDGMWHHLFSSEMKFAFCTGIFCHLCIDAASHVNTMWGDQVFLFSHINWSPISPSVSISLIPPNSVEFHTYITAVVGPSLEIANYMTVASHIKITLASNPDVLPWIDVWWFLQA